MGLLLKLLLINSFFICGFLLLLPDWPWLFAATSVLAFLLLVIQLWRYKQQQEKTVQALCQGLRNLQDGDFSISLTESSERNSFVHNNVITLFNQVTNTLREEKKNTLSAGVIIRQSGQCIECSDYFGQST